ncbi:DNA polymerase III, alpha subunit [Cyclonatronum proteinivorum]|uniref:DNA polymerase III subunit alpha n=1 Tax=Cyclonatronum proteinivorum TaxID=1457365 RepID=A0A345UM93_9BACT|nr:DNA polymerase III subunit alpha [Cyclonatronum proteinivorum]AXJ01595.1 DNA polymerase III, alpha subunit [Cyclonatronum proteinivorum]
MNRFSHLHCHTQFSMLDGAASIKDLVKKAAEQEMPAMAITDHGNMFGVPSFVREAQSAGIKPIIGSEFYITPSGMQDREDRTRYHQVLLAKNMTGYKNLVKLCSVGYVDGLYYKPRIDKETLKNHSEGLIATTCCIASEVNKTIMQKGEEEGRKIFEWYLDVFGEDYYIEIQRHNLADQDTCNAVLLRWAKEYNVKVIATNDSHYVNREDSEAHDILLALQTNADLNDPNRFRFTDDYNNLNPEFYLKTPEEMLELFRDVPESIDNTAEIVDKVEDFSLKSELLLPHYPVPQAFSDMDDYLRHLSYEGARKRYGELTAEVTERIDSELKIIAKMGFAGYFLIVESFTTEARRRGVYVGPGRGSAAGSIVAYCIGIINIDPLRYDLLFERFLNPERVSPPDIDIDFDDHGRQQVIDYVVEQYGRQNVAQIVTYSTMKAKTAIRDVGRVLRVPLPEVMAISKLFPERPGIDTFAKVLDPAKNPDTAEQIKDLFNHPDEQIRKMMKYAKVLEGCARQTGIHAAGVIIAPGEVSNYVPVALSKDKDVITQYDGPSAEECGLLKMDFLGLKTLSILKTAIANVKETTGKEYDLDDITLDDEKTYELYQRGETVGTFQFESDGMRKYLRELKPTVIDDLIAMNALYRPGPMKFIPDYINRKHGREKVDYPHEDLRGILEPTYGIMIYQEQIMKVAQKMGGYSLGEADILRRIMGKKKPDLMVLEEEKFIGRALDLGYDKKVAKEVFDKMAMFAGYGFNKSHSAAYSVLAYQTAYFKAHYPAAFMAAVLTHNMGDIKKVSHFIEEANAMGLTVDLPNINTGAGKFVVKDGRIQYGLEAIKGVGGNAVIAIVEARKEGGVFNSLFDFTYRVDLKSCNKKTIESLIQAGALDDFTKNRAQLLESLEDAITYAVRKQDEKNRNQFSLFGDGTAGGADTTEPRLREGVAWTNMERLKREREHIGFFLSSHPLDKFREDIRLFSSHTLGQDSVGKCEDRDNVRIAGIITSVRMVRDKKGRPMAFCQMEDENAAIEAVAFSEAYDRFLNLLAPDNIVMVEGSIDRRRGEPQIIIKSVDRIENVREKNQGRIRLSLTLDTRIISDEDIHRLAGLLHEHKGQCSLSLRITNADIKNLSMNSRKFVVDPSDQLIREVRKILGREMVALSLKENGMIN